MGIVDTAVLGHLSPTAQGAAGLGASLTFTASFFGMGVMLALDPLVSQAVGAGRLDVARTWYWQGVWLALLTSVPVMAVVAVMPPALVLFGVAPQVAQGAAEYMWWRLPGVPALLLFVSSRSYLQGVGRTAVTFWAMVIANVLNLGLDVAFVFGFGPIPALGIAGASIATVLCSWAQWGVLLLGLGAAPEGTVRQFDWARVRSAASVGLPVGLHFIAESAVFSLTGVLAARLGEVQVAAHQVALQWGSLTFCVASGIGSAAATRVGWGVGAQDPAAARRAGLTAFFSVTAFMALAALVFVVLRRPMAQLMSNDERVVVMVLPLVLVGALFQISDGLQAVGAGVLRGAGETSLTFRANVVGHWLVGLPVAIGLAFGLDLGVVGLWLGLTAGLTVVAVILVKRFLQVSLTTSAHIS